MYWEQSEGNGHGVGTGYSKTAVPEMLDTWIVGRVLIVAAMVVLMHTRASLKIVDLGRW
jgi:hypothetical protein